MLKKFLRSFALLLLLLLLTLSGLLLWPLKDIPKDGIAGDFIVRNVSILDVKEGMWIDNQDLVLIAGRINKVAPSANRIKSESLLEIDGTGQFLIPGLWDMHTHSLKVSPQYNHPLFIANGVTAVREMWGCMSQADSFIACKDDLDRWDDLLSEQNGLSPRYIIKSSFQMNGGSEVPDGMPEFFKAGTEDDVAQLVSFYSQAGVDSLKTYSMLPRESYLELARQARKKDIMLAGHRPFRVSLRDMLQAGQDSIEHPRLFLFECFEDATEFRALTDPLSAYTTAFRASLVDRHDREFCQSLVEEMALSDTWWTPTLQVLKMNAFAADTSFRQNPRLKYIPWVFRKGMWQGDADRAAANTFDQSGRHVDAEMYQLALQHVGQAHKAGVKLLVGTDAGDTYIFPGFSIHDELSAMVEAGLSPADVLRSATLHAAVFSAREDDFGSIEEGKMADLILLGSDPLADIAHTRSIEALFFNGHYYDRNALDGLLEFAQDHAGSFRTNLHIVWDALSSPLIRVQLAD